MDVWLTKRGCDLEYFSVNIGIQKEDKIHKVNKIGRGKHKMYNLEKKYLQVEKYNIYWTQSLMEGILDIGGAICAEVMIHLNDSHTITKDIIL